MGFFSKIADRLKPQKQEQTKQVELPNIQQPKERKVFTFDEAVEVYCDTKHYKCPSKYDFKNYFTDAFEVILANIPNIKITLSADKVKRKNAIENPITDYTNITKSTPLKKFKTFIAFDLETTGLKTGYNDIIEIALIKFVDFKPTEKLHTYLKPRKEIPPDATEVNGITDAMVADAPIFSQIAPTLQDFIGDNILVAHNARFDVKFLHCSGCDLSKHNKKVYDTLSLSRYKLKDYDGTPYENYKLVTLCQEQIIYRKNAHTADSDALACGILFLDILKEVYDTDNLNNIL